MDNLFLLLFLLSLISLIIGIIKPNLVIRWGSPEKRNRKNVFKFYGVSMIVFFIIFGISTPSTDISKTEDSIEKQKEVQEEEKNKQVNEVVIKKDDKDNIQEKREIVKEVDKKDIQENEEAKEESNTAANHEIMDVNYLLMWHDYNEETYKDKYIRIAGKVDYVGKDSINIKEGLIGITGNIYLKFDKSNVIQLESLSEGDYIVVIGKCGGKFSGQISMADVHIETIGGQAIIKANEYKEEADEIFEQERLEAQQLEKEEMDEYKTKATKIKYEDLLREPYKYKGEIIEVTIKISQIMSGGIFTEAGYAGKQGKDEWYINYKLSEYSPRILEGDTIRFYGEFDDLAEMKRALTKTKVFIPKLNAKYFELR